MATGSKKPKRSAERAPARESARPANPLEGEELQEDPRRSAGPARDEKSYRGSSSEGQRDPSATSADKAQQANEDVERKRNVGMNNAGQLAQERGDEDASGERRPDDADAAKGSGLGRIATTAGDDAQHFSHRSRS